ncbi:MULTISPECIES: DUF742 domain-containing protein [Actinokineospora]|uniref:DUF742 domain-containing protein n=1 Tax=Actinokineospora fastidiosa TaxID=1816 RepID=A0A918LED7_9PSEU|nr:MULTISPECIES: DUF742 domain-containing protein [Actinokineospora]UVS80784.1 hypothetical protein Actkin_04536 [Actinokineospora sp. UTMC 2448]GGS37156.1 hypothetical protein GCM10010171_35020 [Actinokineospora fastidiosa]
MSSEHEPTIADVMNGLTRSRKRAKGRSDVDPRPARPVEPQWPDAESVPMVRLPDAAEQAAIVRPYAWTRGRTRSNFELRLETMVSTSPRAADASAFAESEHRAIGELCREPRSVAEVATLLGAPLGVAKVLLGDMAQLGLVTVHKTATGGANRAHLVLMERVLSGLRRL